MKTLIRNLTGIVIGLPLLAGAANTPHFVLFDQPFVMTQSNIRVDIEKVEEKFVEKTNSWTEGKPKKDNVSCELTVRILGRDFAAQNKVIGEHYTGELNYSCDASERKVNFQFGRSIFLGIRNCVKSETYTDNDSCDIYVVAMGEEKSLRAQGGPLLSESKDKRVFYRLSSAPAGNSIANNNLVPLGVRASTIKDFQMLKISMDYKGSEIFIEKPNLMSNLQKGQNIYLTPASNASERDLNLRKNVEGFSDQLGDLLNEIQSASDPKLALSQKGGAFLSTLSRGMKELLAIVSPVHFIQLESALLGHEKAFVDLWKKLEPEIKVDESLRTRYGDVFTEYQNMKTYANDRAQKNQNSDVLSRIYGGDAAGSVDSEPVVGKEFYRTGINEDVAYEAAKSDCFTYLKAFTPEQRSTLFCESKRYWKNQLEGFSIFWVIKR